MTFSASRSPRPRARKRVRRANALAHEYLAYRADVYQHQSNAIVEGLQKRQEAIQSQIDELTRQLGPQADSITSTDPTIARLLATRAGLGNQFNTLNDSIVAQTNSSTAVVDGSFVIDKATPVEASKVKELGRNALSGLAAGLGIGLALVVLLAVTSNRVWRRDDVAEAMRHSVNLSTGPIRVRRRLAKVAMRKLIARPTPELAKVVLHLRRQLAASGWRDRSLAVIAVGGLEVAAASVCATATALARDGDDVVVVDTSERSIVSRGRLLRETESETTGGDARGRIRLVSLADGREAPSVDPDELVLVLGMLDPAEGAEQIRALASTAVAIVIGRPVDDDEPRCGLRHARGRAGRTRLRRPRRLECSRRIVRSISGRSGERAVAQLRIGHLVGVRRGPVSTAAFSQNVDAVNVERGVWRHAGFIWGLLIVNGLTFAAVPTLVPLPSGVVKVVTQSALAVAFVWVLLLNRDRLVRPNLCLGLFSILALSSLVTSVRLNTGIGSLARDVRFVMFLAVLWLLTPLWGRRDMLLARWHVRCLAVLCGTVVLGLVISPGGAFLDGRLYNRIWPTPSTQVAHYAAVLTGMVIVAWLSGVIKTRPALATASAGFAIVVLTHTRTATIGLVVGVTAAMLSLVVVRRRARRGLVVVLVVAVLAAVPFGGLISTWFDRGQSSEELSGLTGRAKVWDQILDEHRPGLELWLGSGLSDKSFQGLPIDNSWLAVYQDQGLVGDLIVAAILIVLLVTSLMRPRGPASALALFLVCYCAISSYTETGLGDASPYILDLAVAASLLMPPLVTSVSAPRARAS